LLAVKGFWTGGAEEVADLSITIGSLPLSCTTTLISPI